MIERVIAFYQSDDYSRMCTGKKEYVSVRIDGKREQKQKRLLLDNLKELHLEFIKSTGDEICFSKFCELRPKWCVTVNSRGMHSVYVCQQHQNVKLLMAAIPDNCDYKEYLAKLVCSIENRTCMMQSCDSCPGKTTLKENYSFPIQDAIQGFYWDNSQATLHPFAIYHMENGKIK